MAGDFDVVILMGSKHDWAVMQHAATTLRELGISYAARVLSAHRTPAETAEYVRQADAAGVKVFIAAAGMSAHLAGAVAAWTVRPVLGVPLSGSELNGLDALLATVQMPAGVPVGTLAIGKAGAINAALLAAAILANERPELRTALLERRRQQADQIINTTLPE